DTDARITRGVTSRVSTGVPRLDEMLGGGLLPGTLAVVYGATGIGKTHLGLTFADHGRVAEAERGVIFDMNGRGDSQRHAEYAERLFGWRLGEWTHAVPPMTDPYPPPAQMAAYYSNAFRWVGRVRDCQVTQQAGTFEVAGSGLVPYKQYRYHLRRSLLYHF